MLIKLTEKEVKLLLRAMTFFEGESYQKVLALHKKIHDQVNKKKK